MSNVHDTRDGGGGGGVYLIPTLLTIDIAFIEMLKDCNDQQHHKAHEKITMVLHAISHADSDSDLKPIYYLIEIAAQQRLEFACSRLPERVNMNSGQFDIVMFPIQISIIVNLASSFGARLNTQVLPLLQSVSRGQP